LKQSTIPTQILSQYGKAEVAEGESVAMKCPERHSTRVTIPVQCRYSSTWIVYPPPQKNWTTSGSSSITERRFPNQIKDERRGYIDSHSLRITLEIYAHLAVLATTPFGETLV